jgi:hypothetical protein
MMAKSTKTIECALCGARLKRNEPHEPKACDTCGEKICPGVQHETVERVVKKDQIFMGASAGQRVRVEPKHLSHASVVKATESVEECEARAAARAAPSRAAVDCVEEVAQLTKASREAWLREKQRLDEIARRQALKAAAEATGGQVV